MEVEGMTIDQQPYCRKPWRDIGYGRKMEKGGVGVTWINNIAYSLVVSGKAQGHYLCSNWYNYIYTI